MEQCRLGSHGSVCTCGAIVPPRAVFGLGSLPGLEEQPPWPEADAGLFLVCQGQQKQASWKWKHFSCAAWAKSTVACMQLLILQLEDPGLLDSLPCFRNRILLILMGQNPQKTVSQTLDVLPVS